jgi:hypothetical protein
VTIIKPRLWHSMRQPVSEWVRRRANGFQALTKMSTQPPVQVDYILSRLNKLQVRTG